jgi:hypothetical protein
MTGSVHNRHSQYVCKEHDYLHHQYGIGSSNNGVICGVGSSNSGGTRYTCNGSRSQDKLKRKDPLWLQQQMLVTGLMMTAWLHNNNKHTQCELVNYLLMAGWVTNWVTLKTGPQDG